MRRALLFSVILFVGCSHQVKVVPPAPILPEAPTGFDLQTNGFTDQKTFDVALAQFIEDAGDELGPFFNARSCADCHSNPVIGGSSQVTEHRIAPDDPDDSIASATLIHDQSIPGFPQQVAPRDAVNALRSSLPLMGDGFVEAVPDDELIEIAKKNGGQYVLVPILESKGRLGVGRFGWKDQHASLLSFAMDADCNEKGVENRGVSGIHCDGKPPTNSVEDVEPTCGGGGEDVDCYAAFVRSLKAPPRGEITLQVSIGEDLFTTVGCATCHVQTLHTDMDSRVNPALRGKLFHPFGDFLLHDVGTGDKVRQGPAPANKVRTSPLWGLRTRSRFLHDLRAMTVTDAIRAHGKEAYSSRANYDALSKEDRTAVLAFLNSL